MPCSLIVLLSGDIFTREVESDQSFMLSKLDSMARHIFEWMHRSIMGASDGRKVIGIKPILLYIYSFQEALDKARQVSKINFHDFQSKWILYI